MTTRREILGGGLTGGAMLLLAGCTGKATARPDPTPDFAAVAKALGGRLGVSALDTGTGKRIGFDADSRYAMCSTFKLPLAAAVLARCDAGTLGVRQPIPFTDADLIGESLLADAEDHRMTVNDLCSAAVTFSDNSAANILLRQIGGPAGLTAFARAQGDATFRLDRTEPTLNANTPGDPRDTTTAAAMATLTARLLTTDALTLMSRARLLDWMSASTTGDKRLRAGLPPLWKTADKTGTSGQGAVNDVAVAWPLDRAPIVIACFVDAPAASPSAREAAHVAVARIVARHFA
jgi:beta-lactamase class A